jgi:hypothetical protein
MALGDRYPKRPTGVSPTDFTCAHYQPVPDGKRCAHYLDNGACDREDELMCVEWLKVNHPESPLARQEAEKKPRTDLFGKPVAVPDRPQRPPEDEDPAPKPADPPARREDEVPIVRRVTDEEIASFRALGVSVCIATEHVGEVWLVPEYTKKERFELRIDHAATLTAICSAFPGAKVTEIHRDTGEHPDAGQDVPQD